MGDLYVSTKYLPGIRLEAVSKARPRLARALYGGRLIEEYRSILESEKLSSEKFWALEKRIRQDKKSPGVIVDMRRSTMRLELMQLLFLGVIRPSDLEGFSQELRDGLIFVMQKYSGQGE